MILDLTILVTALQPDLDQGAIRHLVIGLGPQFLSHGYQQVPDLKMHPVLSDHSFELSSGELNSRWCEPLCPCCPCSQTGRHKSENTGRQNQRQLGANAKEPD